MTVTDLYGVKIRVTDLPAAIRQAKEFKGYTCVDHPMPERQKYWTDLYQKLLELQQELTTKTNNHDG